MSPLLTYAEEKVQTAFQNDSLEDERRSYDWIGKMWALRVEQTRRLEEWETQVLKHLMDVSGNEEAIIKAHQLLCEEVTDRLNSFLSIWELAIETGDSLYAASRKRDVDLDKLLSLTGAQEKAQELLTEARRRLRGKRLIRDLTFDTGRIQLPS